MQLILEDITVREIQAVGYALREPEKVIALSGDVNMGKIPVSLCDDEQNDTVPDSNTPVVADNVVTAQQVFSPTHESAHVDNSELDNDGYPWDERIHSSNKTKVQSGTWKLKRGVKESDDVVRAVRAESIPEVGSSVSTPPVPLEQTQVVPTSPPPPPPQVESGVTFQMLMASISMGIASKKFAAATVTNILSKYGVANTGELAKPENQIHFASIWQELENYNG